MVFRSLEEHRLVHRHVGDAPLIFVLIKTMLVFGVINVVFWYKNARNWQL
jgi:hypothetical protein